MISRQKKLRQRVNSWRGVESYFLFLDSAASIISLGSAAYSGLQECGRFSARLPHGQQSSAAFLELGGNAMICRDTPQTLQTARSTHICGMYTIQRRSSSVGWFRSAAKWSRNIGWSAHQPGASLYPGREGLHKTVIFNLPLCHFKESRPGCDVPPPRICEET